MPRHFSWVKSHYHVNNAGVNGCSNIAPLPFDAPRFWKDPEYDPANDPNQERRGSWKYYYFALPKAAWVKDRHDAAALKASQFRQCRNYGYDLAEMKYGAGFEQETVSQGRMAKQGIHVAYGMTGVHLRRHNKYCNVCFDCAQVLDSAPGLLIKNYRKLPVIERRSNANSVDAGEKDDFWMTLARAGINIQDPRKQELIRRGTSDPAFVKLYSDAQKLRARHHQVHEGSTKFKKLPHIHVQTTLDDSVLAKTRNKSVVGGAANMAQKERTEKANLEDAMQTVKKLLSNEGVPAAELKQPAFRNLLREIQTRYEHNGKLGVDPPEFGKRHDPEQYRTEYRNETRSDWGDDMEYQNCLRIVTWQPQRGTFNVHPAQGDTSGWSTSENFSGYTADEYVTEVHYPGRGYRRGRGYYPPDDDTNEARWDPLKEEQKSTMWKGDMDVANGNSGLPTTQHRKLQQTRLFITYSLHRSTRGMEAREILEKISNAIWATFGNDTVLANMLVFGKTLYNVNTNKKIKKRTKEQMAAERTMGQGDNLGGDYYSIAEFRKITAPNKTEKLPEFYASAGASSYVSDTYETHVVDVDFEAGVEIGPKMKHPHFHILLTVNHYSYLQLDYFQLRYYLESLFVGSPDPIDKLVSAEELNDQDLLDSKYTLLDSSGLPFYTANENPWMDVKLYPQDNWEDILSAYVRKGSGGVIDAHVAHTGQVINSDRLRAAQGVATGAQNSNEDNDNE